jgi:hypothetical protein
MKGVSHLIHHIPIHLFVLNHLEGIGDERERWRIENQKIKSAAQKSPSFAYPLGTSVALFYSSHHSPRIDHRFGFSGNALIIQTTMVGYHHHSMALL